MTFKNLILSEKRSDRIIRHLLFWSFWGFYFTMVRYLNPMSLKTAGHFEVFFTCVGEAFLGLFAQGFLAYPFLYFIIPRYVLTGKYVGAFAWFIVFLFLSFSVNVAFLIYIPQYLPTYFSRTYKLFEGMNFMDKLTTAYLASLQGALAGSALAGSFKLFKYYYVKERLNQQLQKENMEAQLQLLKAQVHPHFLFNTLNNIYSQAQEESPRSAKMIMELSHILRYLLHEGRLAKVPLENELQMMTDYINLEKIRYDKKLDMHVSLPQKTDDIHIAPLLLLPLVENCFKHGASKMIDHPWVNLKIELQDELMVVKIMNGKKAGIKSPRERSGTGIENVKQRLELLYKDKHELQINEDEEVFIVNLKIDLERISSNETKPQPSLQEEYA